jgi:hypothetical protein
LLLVVQVVVDIMVYPDILRLVAVLVVYSQDTLILLLVLLIL